MPYRQQLSLILIALAAVSLGSAATAQENNSVVLAREGQPVATIVLAERPTCAAQFAAEELRYHLRKITGAVLPMATDTAPVVGPRILVGESRETAALKLPGEPLASQEYLIRFLPDTLVLLGKDADQLTAVQYDPDNPVGYGTWPNLLSEQGTCYAVYDFLERYCGVRWFRPGELGTVCPQRATLTVSGPDVRRSLEFKYRYAYPQMGSSAYEQYTNLWNWGNRAPAEAAKVAEVEALAYPELEGKSPQAKAGMFQLFIHRMRLGGEPFAQGHAFYGYYDRFWERNPRNPDVFEGARPLWFAQGYSQKPSPIVAEDEPVEKTYYEKPPQMCFTNEEFIQQVLADASAYWDSGVKKAGSVVVDGDYLSAAAMDNSLWCKCPICQALIKPEATRGQGQFSNDRASEYMFWFANELARRIRKDYPDKFVTQAAYSQYAYPPEGFEVEPNVAIVPCLHSRAVYSPSVMDNDRAILQAWREKAPQNRLFVYQYYLFPNYSAVLGKFHCFPGFFAHGIAENFKLYHQYRARGSFYEGLGQDVEMYVSCKLMDDATRDIDILLDEYFTGMYGAAAQPMKDFYLLVERTYSDPANYPEGESAQTPEIAWDRLGTEERMAQLGAFMAQAHAAAQTEQEKARVALFDKQVWEYMTTGRQQYVERKSAKIPSVTVPKIAEVGGDPAKVDWEQAPRLTGWSMPEGGEVPRKLEGRLAHDGKFLYMQLTELVDPKTLITDMVSVWSGDDWELFFARERVKPYRQVGLGPGGNFSALAHGEVAGQPMAPWDSGITVISDTSAPDRWTVHVVFPLDKLLPGGVRSGDKVYFNANRIWWAGGRGHQMTWSPLAAVHQLDRFGELILE